MWQVAAAASGMEDLMDLSTWSVGLSLIVLTIAIHTTAVVLMAFGLETRTRVRAGRADRLRAIPAMIGHIGAVALILAALHGLEAMLWASAYWWLGALDSFADASVYALATMTTFEIPGLTVPSRWHMLSALQAVNGVLLFGISTAFLFAVIQVHWQSFSHRHQTVH
jgi:hypothetical protein